jgi:replicative DNA helicase
MNNEPKIQDPKPRYSNPPSPVTTIDRVPPHSAEAEIGVLGAILLDAGTVMGLCFERQLTPESFYVPMHRMVFEAMLDLYNATRPLDILTVGERLKVTGILDQIGGPTALNRIVDATPTSAHAEYYMDIVRDHHLKRQVIDAGRSSERLSYDPSYNGGEVLGLAEQSLFKISANQHGQGQDWGRLLQEMGAILDNEHRGFQGLMTGFKNLDQHLEGLKPANMVVLAARPSMGKTSLAMNIVENIGLGRHAPDSTGRPVGVFSLEMAAIDLVKRMVCCHAEVPSSHISKGFISAVNAGRIRSALEALAEARIYLDDSAGLDINDLRSRARRMRMKHGVELIVIDYLQLIQSKDYAKQGRQIEITNVSAGLKGMAKELGIPVLVLSQLSRAPETRGGEERPKLSDLRDSGSIEQDADIVMLLRRPSRITNSTETDRTLAIVEIAKNRNGPAMMDIEMHFDEHLTRFRDRAPRGVDEAAIKPSA